MSRPIVNEFGGLARQLDLWLLICGDMLCEGSKIPIEDLVIIGMGLKLFEDVQDVTMANRVLLIIEKIRYRYGYGLLRVVKDKYDEQYVEMVADRSSLRRWVALRDWFIFGSETIMGNWLKRNEPRGLSLVLKRISDFPVNLDFSKLIVLQLKYGEDSTTLPFHFFQGMKDLRVLSLDVPALPYSLNMLRNLRTLRLKVLKLRNMSVIGGLVNLEFLSVSTASSIDIPRVMEQLKKLKLLDLKKTNLTYISRGVFPGMLKLEELYLPFSFKRWGCRANEDHDEWDSGEEDHYGDEDRINASLSEIFLLSLKALQICIPNASLLLKESPTYKSILQFKILGPNNPIYQPFDNCSMNIVQLTGDVCDIKGSGICNLMSRTEHLSLTRVKNLKNLVHHLKDYHFRWLKKMIISECDELEYIFDVMENYTYFSKLEALKSLHLSMLSNLKEIWRGTHIGGFWNLSQINIRFCHKLKYAFPMLMAGQLRNLKSIEILDCDELEGIFKAGVDDCPHEICSLEELHLHSLPKLVGFLVEKDYTNNEAVSNSMNLEAQISGFDVDSRRTSKSRWKNKLLLYTQKVVHSKQVERKRLLLGQVGRTWIVWISLAMKN